MNVAFSLAMTNDNKVSRTFAQEWMVHPTVKSNRTIANSKYNSQNNELMIERDPKHYTNREC